jgi:hypothetical protein
VTSAAKMESLREIANTTLQPTTPEDLATRQSTDQRIAAVDTRMKVLNRALNGWAKFARTEDEVLRVRQYEGEREWLIEHRVALLERRVALDSLLQSTYHRCFQRAVKEALPDAEYRRLIDRANELLEDAKRRATIQGVGAAITPTGNSGTMRTRK